jgi:hypothetical protein
MFTGRIRRRVINETALHIGLTGNELAVRVPHREIETAFNLADDIISQDVFNHLCVIVDMVDLIMRRMGQVEFPEPVVSDDPAGGFPTPGCQEEALFLSVGRALLLRVPTGKAAPNQSFGPRGDHRPRFVPPLRYLGDGNPGLGEIATLPNVEDGFQ